MICIGIEVDHGRISNWRGLTLYKVMFPALLATLLPQWAVARVTEYNLTIRREEVKITQKSASAMTINGSIPGPVLRFTEGDTARIHVRNNMDAPTSIHWHGLLIPPEMDGVPYVSFAGIAPGETFTYEFMIRQSGTYWYHSHTELQEQRGVYGGIVIAPRKGLTHSTDRDHVVLLSDWTNEDPHAVLRTLKRGSHWYALAKGGSQSLIGAMRARRFGDFLKRELQRMPSMDISDIAYDRFLSNGKENIHLDAQPGETVRLRIVDGSATTFFHLTWAGGPMRVVAADGQNVEPFDVDRLLIGVAETYDILLQTPLTGTFELRATAHDGSAATSIWLGEGARQYAPSVPKPDVYHSMDKLSFEKVFALTPAGSMGMENRKVRSGMFDSPGMAMGAIDMDEMDSTGMSDHDMSQLQMDGMKMNKNGHAGMEHGSLAPAPMHGLDHLGMSPSVKNAAASGEPARRNGKSHAWDFRPLGPDISSARPLVIDGMDPRRPWPPYEKIQSQEPTAFRGNRHVRDIRLTLDGDMERYVWLINNRALSQGDSILIKEGEVVRFIMINRTMMHHPMHLHGHLFRVVNKYGDYSPLKHTVEVTPMSTSVIEFDANEIGDWFFHCHLLYHMMSGMARTVHYEGFDPGVEVKKIRRKLYRDSWYAMANIELLSNMSEGNVNLSNTFNIFSLDWEAGWPWFTDVSWKGLLTYERYFNRFFSLFAGGDMQGENGEVEYARAIGGLRYVLPLNIEASVWLHSDMGVQFNVVKEIMITPRLGIVGEFDLDTRYTDIEGAAGFNYTVSKTFRIIGKWHSEYGFGGGVGALF